MMHIDEFLKIGSIISVDKDRVLIGYGPREKHGLPGQFYFPDFFLRDKTPWSLHEETTIMQKTELVDRLSAEFKETPPPLWKMPDAHVFFDAFSEVTSGRLQKVVPYVMATSGVRMTKERLLHALIHALAKADEQFIYGSWHAGGGILGVTPELLFRLNGNTLHTAAVAGTAVATRPMQEFLNDPKESREHELVVAGITESLKAFGQPTAGTRCVVKTSSLMHLMTPITLTLTGPADVATLVAALHPTPALGAYPKVAGQQWLEEYAERVPRGRYGAPVGYCYGNDVALFVAIRNVQWSIRGMAIGSGCGVINTSSEEGEWREVQLKIQSVQETLGLTTSALPASSFSVL